MRIISAAQYVEDLDYDTAESRQSMLSICSFQKLILCVAFFLYIVNTLLDY